MFIQGAAERAWRRGSPVSGPSCDAADADTGAVSTGSVYTGTESEMERGAERTLEADLTIHIGWEHLAQSFAKTYTQADLYAVDWRAVQETHKLSFT